MIKAGIPEHGLKECYWRSEGVEWRSNAKHRKAMLDGAAREKGGGGGELSRDARRWQQTGL